ncbi:MAG: PaaI family thioesterase [Desulfarculus sp.]|nr:PaaI family thioesterase [Desulfarculus sp.]
MDWTEHYRKLERMYHTAPINEFFQPKIQVEKGRCQIVILARPALHHAAHAVHGATYFKALDDAAFFAVQSQVEGYFVVTANFNLFLERPVQVGAMRAVGEVVMAGKNLFVAQAALTDDQGRELARGGGNFVRSGIRLTPEIGYA